MTLSTGIGNDQARGIAMQNDGKVVVAGFANNGSNNDIAVARFTATGDLDASFGNGGVVITDFGGEDRGFAVALQSDGKVVVVGDSSQHFVAVRYTAAGVLDSSFGTGGKAMATMGSVDIGFAVAVQNDGKILVAGTTTTAGNSDFAVLRYEANGASDATFGSGGKVLTPIGTSNDVCRCVALQADGKIVAAGYSSNGSNLDVAVVRYTAAGAPDSSFGTMGKVTTAIGNSDESGEGLAVQSDGSLVVAGYTSNGSYNNAMVVRYNSVGALDASFGNGGVTIAPVSGADNASNSVALQKDGKIVVGGYAIVGGQKDIALARYATTGALDPSFGTAGKLTAVIGTADDQLQAVAVQPDGKIVAAGYSSNGTTTDFAVVRFEGNLPSLSVYPFIGSAADGGRPLDGLLLASDGNYYGTTTKGGTNGLGTVFRVTPSGARSVLFSFSGAADGATPSAHLVEGNDGALYSTTEGNGGGGGTVFKINKNGTGFAVLKALNGNNEGAGPLAGLTPRGNGTFLGVARNGGSTLTGTVFQIGTTPGSYSFLTSVSNPSGQEPLAKPLKGSDGFYYGGCSLGGTNGNGTFYRMDEAGTITVLRAFVAGTDGSTPQGTPVEISPGVFIGTASAGGANDCGTLYRVTAGGTFTLLHHFGAGTDGQEPVGALLLDGGMVYGTTRFGGAFNRGTLWRYSPDSGEYMVLHEFPESEATDIRGGLIVGHDGRLWGVSLRAGGADQGVVFALAEAPVVSVAPASSIISTSATINGTVNPSRLRTTARFEYGLTLAYGSVANVVLSPADGHTAQPVSANLTGLTPGAAYHYRITAENAGGKLSSSDATFVAASPLPLVGTGSPAAVTNTSATLKGQVNPSGSATQVFFEYGTTALYGKTTPTQDVGSETGIVDVSAPVDSLTTGATYHCRLVAMNQGGRADGNDVTFVAMPGSGSGPTAPPTVTTGSVVDITPDSATLQGTVNANGGTTSAYFEFGETILYNQFSVSQDIGSANSGVYVPAKVSSLKPGTTYHYRLVAKNSLDTTRGNDATFTTQFLPPVATTGAASVAIAGATLRGSATPNGLQTNTRFEYGPTAEYGQLVQIAAMFNDSASHDVSAMIPQASLNPGAVYHYRLVATQLGGAETPGVDATFRAVVPPTATTEDPTDKTSSTASLHGTVTPNDFAVTVRFEFAESEEKLGTTATQVNAAPFALGTGTTSVQVSALNVSGFALPADILSKPYVYRTVVTAAGDPTLVYGATKTFDIEDTPPVANDDQLFITGADQGQVSPLANDTDADPGESATLVLDGIAANPPGGTAFIGGNSITYDPGDSFAGIDSFQYRIKDIHHATATATVRVYSFSSVKGAYVGLISSNGAANQNGQINLMLNGAGSVSGALLWKGKTYRIKGPLDPTGTLERNLPDGLKLRLALDAEAGALTGTLTDGVIVADIQVFKTGGSENDVPGADSVQPGTYTAFIEDEGGAARALGNGATPTTEIAGTGFSLIKIVKKSKAARFVGQLPDGEKYSSGSGLLRELRYRVNDSLYKRKKQLFGLLSGYVSYEAAVSRGGQTPGLSAQLDWSKESEADQDYYPGGFAKTAFLDAVQYPVPPRGQIVPTLEVKPINARLQLTSGNLDAEVVPIVADMKISAFGGKVVGTNPYRIKMKINPLKGSFTGSFEHPQLGKTTFAGAFKVVLVATGRGTFKGRTEAGKVVVLKQ